MTMNFWNRMKTGLRADAHGIVDALEDEALLLRQHLRDAEAEVERKRARLVELEATTEKLTTERSRARAEAQRTDRDASFALSEGREDLARFALKQHLTETRKLERIDARHQVIVAERQKLEELLATQKAALDELKTRVHAHLSAREAPESSFDVPPVGEEQVELELLRRRRSAAESSSVTAKFPTSETEESRA
jgi:phage shock protein A